MGTGTSLCEPFQIIKKLTSNCKIIIRSQAPVYFTFLGEKGYFTQFARQIQVFVFKSILSAHGINRLA
ncbi:MAG: hypothetical protein OEX00_07855, partial [Gammaproteobacteria bacterium]|nr:hypothetical protein [Gammaproteobacteria bacterium]